MTCLNFILQEYVIYKEFWSMTNRSGMALLPSGPLYYEMIGEGRPMVLIHGLLMHSGLWDNELAAFNERFQVIRYDVSGFGKSPITPTADADGLLQLLDHLQIPQAILLGMSMGAEIALGFTLNHPDRVSGLVLVSPGLDDYPYPEEASQRWQNFIEPVMRKDFHEAREVFLRQVVDGPAGPAASVVRDRARQLMASYTFSNFFPPESAPEESQQAETASAPTGVDIPKGTTERLSEITVPTLMMVGERDHADVLAISEVLASQIQQTKKVVIPDAAHIINLDQPGVFQETVLSFLS
jgi:3-oxoadipate enol-lactonase